MPVGREEKVFRCRGIDSFDRLLDLDRPASILEHELAGAAGAEARALKSSPSHRG